MSGPDLLRNGTRPIVVGIDHIALRVRDLDAIAAFYTDGLGLTLERRRDDIGLIHLRAGRSLVDLVAIDGSLGRRSVSVPDVGRGNLDHVCLAVGDFDPEQVRRQLLVLGAFPESTTVRYGADGEGPSIYLRDPEGNGLEQRGQAVRP